MVLDTSWHNTQQYKVRIKGKVEQSRERTSALSYIHLGVEAIKKRAFWSPLTTVANFTYNLHLKNVLIFMFLIRYFFIKPRDSKTI